MTILRIFKTGLKNLTILCLVSALIMVLTYLFMPPLNDRNWMVGQTELASIDITASNLITVNNLRDFDWTADEIVPTYKNVTFKLEDINTLQVAVSHFSSINEIAHIFLVFELINGEQFGFSIEARRETNEPYSILGGLFAQYEIIYLFASADDLLNLRKSRGEPVYLYTTKANPAQIQTIFKRMIVKTNKLAEEPQLYHILFKNCATGVVDLVSDISEHQYSKLVQAAMPGNAGKALFEMGLIDTDKSDFRAVQQEALVK